MDSSSAFVIYNYFNCANKYRNCFKVYSYVIYIITLNRPNVKGIKAIRNVSKNSKAVQFQRDLILSARLILPFCHKQYSKKLMPTLSLHIYNAVRHCKSNGIIYFYFINHSSHTDKNPATINPIAANTPPINPYGIWVKACSILSILAIAEANTV